jgi:phosphoribosylformimino-5-aminoimidazole carboxamide ribotide isomerase
MRIIPAIDIIDGKCVRLAQGDYGQKKVYNENPLEVAKGFEDAGLSYLHLVDLDGAKAGKVTNWKIVESLTTGTTLQIDFGGGIKTADEIEKLFDYGISQVNLGSIAVKNPSLVYEWIESFGADKIILSADVKHKLVAISGWMENSALTVEDFIADYIRKGITYVTCTDISTDGMLSGPNTHLYTELLELFPELKLVASGGVSSMDDLLQLKAAGCMGAIVGKAIYEGRVSLKQLREL